MKLTLTEIEEVIDSLGSAVTRAKEARRVARKVYGSDTEISIQLKYAYQDVQKAVKVLEMRGD